MTKISYNFGLYLIQNSDRAHNTSNMRHRTRHSKMWTTFSDALVMAQVPVEKEHSSEIFFFTYSIGGFLVKPVILSSFDKSYGLPVQLYPTDKSGSSTPSYPVVF